MKRFRVQVSGDVEMALAMMSLEEASRWGERVERLARTGQVQGARPIRGAPDLHRVAAGGWVLIYQKAARGRRITLACLAARRPQAIVDELLGRAVD